MTTYEQWRAELVALDAEIKRNMESAKKAKAEQDWTSFGIYDRAANSCRAQRKTLLRREPPK